MRLRNVKRWMWGLLGIVSLCVVFGGVSMVHAESAPLPPHGLEALKQPAAMPSFNLPTTDGGTFDSATLIGNVVVVRFWATW